MKTKIFLSALSLISVLTLQGQWIYTDLSEAKCQMGSTALGRKAYFAGGNNGTTALAAVEIYDIENEEWDSTINLSHGRFFPACAAAGNKVFFAGGIDFFTMECFDTVDIWNADTKEWTKEYLSEARMTQAVSKGNKVLFAGGANLAAGISYDIVDIYDIETMEWDVKHLSMPRAAMACGVIGDLAFFAGGVNVQTGQVSDRIDIYHFPTNTWTTANLSEARAFLAAAVSGSKILIAGGTNALNNPSNRVDIYDTVTGEWTTETLSEPRSFHQNNAATVLGKAYFVGGGTIDLSSYNWTSASSAIDIYCSLTDSWSTESLTQPLYNHEIAGVQDHMVAAGGATFISPNVSISVSNTEIYIDPDSSCIIDDLPVLPLHSGNLEVYPNPSSDYVTIETPALTVSNKLTILNLNGQELVSYKLTENKIQILISNLPAGIYFARLSDETGVKVGKIVKW